jgi:signal transduction histidine kinase
VFANLLNNAAKFTPDGGRISISAELKKRNHETVGGTSPEDVVVCVRDNGIGMAAEMVPQVFDLFVQAGTSPDPSLGIGLTLVRRLVRLHSGSVWARSEGQGKGSEFFVRLPLAAALAAPEAQYPVDSQAARPRPQRRN